PWHKELIRRILANRLCKGELVHGRNRSVASGGNASAREAVPEHEWVVTPVPHLRIVSDQLWDRVRAARAKTRVKYGVQKVFSRGTEAERKQVGAVPVRSGAGSEHMLNQIARCGLCDGTLSLQPTKGVGRYYCNKHKRGVGCTNSRGVPADLLEDFVRQALHEKLTDQRNVDALSQVEKQELERWRTKHALKAAARASSEKEVKKLEALVERLKDAIENGQPVGDRLTQRTAELEALKAMLSAKPPQQLTRAAIAKRIDDALAPFERMMNDYKEAKGEIVTEARESLRALGI